MKNLLSKKKKGIELSSKVLKSRFIISPMNSLPQVMNEITKILKALYFTS